ncbi:MAG: WhiB family transcriptional regulator [Actinobacteria bacterium]|nr:WhiB family transcriptional regulator [Actinomycetota bacterium]MCG2800873.1 WhiB family transcriptional regulator [Cellulomonas sp.]
MLLDLPTTGLGAQRQLDPDGLDQLVVDRAPCRSHDPELWFAERTAQVEQAKALCRLCPLMADCLAGAIDRAEPWGVWGGQVFVGGVVVATKRGRGRPRKDAAVA